VINRGRNDAGKSTVFRRFGDLVRGGRKDEFADLGRRKIGRRFCLHAAKTDIMDF
jgi:hypothetical protein